MSNCIKGIYIRELPNRFRCEIEIDGEIIECYQPISFKLSKVMRPEGKEVLLNETCNKKSPFKYSVYAIKTEENRYALVNLQMVNSFFDCGIKTNRFDYLGSRSKIKRETMIEDLKTDLFIEDNNTIIEIKTIFSFEENVLFPNLSSERLWEQIKKIIEKMNKGYRAFLLLAVLTDTPKEIVIHTDNLENENIIRNACEGGLVIKAYRIENVENIPEIGEELKVIVEM